MRDRIVNSSSSDHLLHNFRKWKICIRNTCNEIRGKRVGPLGSMDYAGSLKLFYTKSVNKFFVYAEKLVNMAYMPKHFAFKIRYLSAVSYIIHS